MFKKNRRAVVMVCAVVILGAAWMTSWFIANRQVLPTGFHWHEAKIYLKPGGISRYRPWRGVAAPVTFFFPSGTHPSDVSITVNGFEVLPKYAKYAEEETSMIPPRLELESYVDGFTGTIAVGRGKSVPLAVTREESQRWPGEYKQSKVRVETVVETGSASVDIYYMDIPDV